MGIQSCFEISMVKQKVAWAAESIVANMIGRHRSSSACVMVASVVVALAIVPHVVLTAVIAGCGCGCGCECGCHRRHPQRHQVRS